MFVHLPFRHHHVRSHHRNSLPTTRDYATRSPSPPLRDVGPINNAPQQGQGEENPSCPRYRGMRVAHRHSMEELGREEREGGPKKWEAQLVHHENDP
jgi:hypothetical protein